MRMDLAAVLAELVKRLPAEQFTSISGELTGDRRAGRPNILLRVIYGGEERVFQYHVQREGPVHTVARSLAEDTVRSAPQRIFEGVGERLQPNDVYYPTALGITPTTIPGQPSGPVYR